MKVAIALRYAVSLPERLVRAAAAGAGGLLYEAAVVLLPGWLRRTRLYRVLAANALRVVVELVGGVQGVLPPEEVTAGELALRKAAGTGIEMAGLLVVGWSPLWLLAVAADLTGGTRAYLRALVAELQRSELLPKDAEFASVEELLDALEQTSALMAETLDVPPLTVREMRRSWQVLRTNAGAIPNPARLARIYALLHQVAHQEGRSVGAVSAAIAAGAVRTGLQMGHTFVFDYYQQALRTIVTEGLPAYLRRVTRPYRAAAADHLDPGHLTHTERLLGRFRRRRIGDGRDNSS
jgi:hypothetical protein